MPKLKLDDGRSGTITPTEFPLMGGEMMRFQGTGPLA